MTRASESDLQSFRTTAERFAKKELEPKAIEIDNYPFREFNQAALAVAQDAGLLKVMVPEKHGGTGQGMSALSEILMALARADASFAAVVFIHTLSLSALLRWGSKRAIEKHIDAGLIAFSAYDLPADLPCDISADKKGSGFLLQGTLEYLPLAPVADAMIVPARLEGSEKVGFFAVECQAEGVSMSDPVVSLGLRNCPAADVKLEGVEVSKDALLSADGEADYAALAAEFCTGAAAMAIGVVQGSYETAKDYAKERYQGGRMIIDYDMVRQMIAGLKVIAEAGQSLVRNMAAAVDAGQPFPVCSAGSVLLTEQASRVTADGVQCLGGYGYMEEYGQEKRMRDAKQIQSLLGASPARRLELMAEVLRQEA